MVWRLMRKTIKYSLVIVNIAAAVGLVIGCYSGYFWGGKYWITGLFTLASIYFLIIICLFFLFWLFVRPSLTLISICVVLVCWNPIKQITPLHFDHSFSFKKKYNSIRVMSWNVEFFNILAHKYHPEKKQAMFNFINEVKPDIACFQEMVLSDSSNYSINNIHDFKRKIGLYQYHYAFNPVFNFDKRHHFGIIIFSKYPIIKRETVVFKPYDYNSTFQYVDIVKNTDTFRIINIHLQTLRFSKRNKIYLDNPSFSNEEAIQESKNIIWKFKVGYENRSRQIDHISNAIDQSPYPVILCGDFNDVPNSYAYSSVRKKLKNTFAETGLGIGNTFDGISPTLRIDNIFADEKFNILQFDRFKKKNLSDHFPIVADLQFINKD